MDTLLMREQFAQQKKIYESAVLHFAGVDGFDVYNCSIPFTWQGKEYIYGRVEKRAEWARSWVRLFEKESQDHYRLVDHSMVYQLEDPFIALIHGEMVLGGTHVRKKCGQVDTYYGYFYRGTDLEDLTYFTTGPDYMKDIRLIELQDGRIGVFSRPRNEAIRRKYGSESIIGFSIIDSLDALTAEVVESAPIVQDLFGPDEWGGCNQCYLLKDGKIGVIAHKSYPGEMVGDTPMKVYTNMSFVFDPETHKAQEQKLIGTADCYPAFPPKRPDLADCAFTSGITPWTDGKVALYSGIGDTMEGRIVIDDPFAGHGGPIWTL